MPSIPKTTILTKSFEALMQFGVAPGCPISYLSYDGVGESEKNGPFPDANLKDLVVA